jgi:hypothetical protein
MRKMRTTNVARTPIANGILWLTSLHIGVSAVIFIFWRMQGDNAEIERFFRYQGSLFFVLCAVAELWLAWTVFKQFMPGEPMRMAWLLISIASFYRFAGYLFSKILNTESYLNPIFLVLGPQNKSLYQNFQHFGLLVSGPLCMAVMAVGLFLILRILRRLGILSRLHLIDIVLIAAVAIFTIRQVYEIVQWVQATRPAFDPFKMLSWPSDLLLGILLVEAILIRRSAADIGWGLLAKSWRAFSLGILFTSLGDIGLWATSHNYLPWPYSSITWYVWFLASAAYALGPAYQVEACRRAYREAEYTSSGPQAPASISE